MAISMLSGPPRRQTCTNAWLAMAALGSDAQPLLSGHVPDPESMAILRVDANLVLVPVTVTNNRGAVIPNLDRRDFVLTEENRRQEILSFSHETAPISLGVVVDLSGSMAHKIAKVHAAVGGAAGQSGA